MTVITSISIGFMLVLDQKAFGHLNLISLSMRFGVGTSFVPGLEVGLKRYSRQFPDLFANYTYRSVYIPEISNGPCEAGGRQNVIERLSELYSSGQLQKPDTILIVPIPCLIPFVPVADFARELDLLVLDCAPADAALANRQRFPTVVSFSYADVTAYGAAVVAVMRRFAWKNIVLISDVGATSLFGDSVKVAQMSSGILHELNRVLPTINFLVVKTEASPNKWTLALQKAQNYSRIFLVCTYPYVLRDLLMAAVELDMARGAYIFFLFYNMRMPGESLMEWEKGDEMDKIIQPMVPNIFVVSSPTIEWRKISNLTKQIVSRLRQWITRPPTECKILENPDFEFNEIATTCFEMTEMMSKVFHSVSSKTSGSTANFSNTLPSGRELARMFYNRTILGDGVGKDISISSSGMRRFNVEIQQYNFSSKRFEKVLMFDTETRQIRDIVDITWKSGHVPADQPQCLNVEKCTFERNILLQNTATVVLSAVCVILAVTGTAILMRRHRYVHQYEWRLDRRLLEVTDINDDSEEVPVSMHPSNGKHSGVIKIVEPIVLPLPMRKGRRKVS